MKKQRPRTRRRKKKLPMLPIRRPMQKKFNRTTRVDRSKQHKYLSSLGIPRSQNGNKFGLRKRLGIAKRMTSDALALEKVL